MKYMKALLWCCACALAVVSVGAYAEKPITPVNHVDMSRFMGRWYLIASVPTRFTKNGLPQQRKVDVGQCPTYLFEDSWAAEAVVNKA